MMHGVRVNEATSSSSYMLNHQLGGGLVDDQWMMHQLSSFWFWACSCEWVNG